MMILYINTMPVAILKTLHKAGGNSIAMDDTNTFAVLIDDKSDRPKSEAIIADEVTSFGIKGANGTYMANWIDKELQWGVFRAGNNVWFRTGLERERAIDLAYELANGSKESGLA
jgi:hypothetical protein